MGSGGPDEWGAFREGLGSSLDHLGLRVEKWIAFDDEGGVSKWTAIMDEKVVLVEVKPRARISDVILFKRKASFHIRKTGKAPLRLLVVTHYADESALEAAKPSASKSAKV